MSIRRRSVDGIRKCKPAVMHAKPHVANSAFIAKLISRPRLLYTSRGQTPSRCVFASQSCRHRSDYNKLTITSAFSVEGKPTGGTEGSNQGDLWVSRTVPPAKMMDPLETSPLLRLAPELRNHIYIDALVANIPVDVNTRPALLQSCKQIRARQAKFSGPRTASA